jgi:hypothetical protein
MPQTRLQKFFFMALTVLASVTSFTIYNIAISRGGMTNGVFILAMKEIPVEFVIAFLLEAIFVFKLAQKLAFRYVDPKKDRRIVVILAITAMTICLMCPAMSLVATILYNGFNSDFLANWLQKIAYNFPFAFFTQIFIIGPFVRSVFKISFKVSNTTVPA